MFTFADIQQALTKCLAAEPPVGFKLSSDASQLAAVYAEMIFYGQSTRQLSDVNDKGRAAFERWA